MVRNLARDVLRAQGYAVLEAANATEALEIGQSHNGPIHLLLTDVVMPGVSGRELVEQMSKARPKSRVLFMSGYTDDAVLRRGLLADPSTFIQKPFSATDLARKVREVLITA